MTVQTMSGPWMGTNPMFDMWQDVMRKTMALPQVMETAQRVRVGATPHRTVHREDNVRLLRYTTTTPREFETPLLVVFALVNRPYILDLREGKSVVSQFVQRGHQVYNLDWGVPADGDSDLGLEDYVLRYLDHAVDEIRRREGVDKINLLGYCMGGTMTTMYAALRPEKVRNLVLLAAPVDWSSRDSLLNLWTDERIFDVDRVLEVHGNMPAQWLQMSFLMLKPVQNLIEKYTTFYDNIENPKFLEDFFAMETWLNDNIPVAGAVFRQFVKNCFQANQLIQGRLEIGDERVDLKRITCPVLNLIADHDHLVPPSHSLPLQDAVGSTSCETIQFPAGHIGMAVGSRAHRDLWPRAAEWVAQRSSKVSPTGRGQHDSQ